MIQNGMIKVLYSFPSPGFRLQGLTSSVRSMVIVGDAHPTNGRAAKRVEMGTARAWFAAAMLSLTACLLYTDQNLLSPVVSVGVAMVGITLFFVVALFAPTVKQHNVCWEHMLAK